MDEKIRDAFHQAWTGEAKAALRLKIFANKAEQEGYPQIARLFRVISLSEKIHGERNLRMLREIRSTEKNLEESFQSETKVAGVAYDNFIKMANELEDLDSAVVLSQNRDVEDTHARLYKEAMNHLMEERETSYHVCKVCGFISDGVLPDQCPVCGAEKEHFFEYK